jgi:hypothetical protein
MRIAVRASPCYGRFDANVRALAEGVVLSRVRSWVMFLLFSLSLALALPGVWTTDL